MAERQVPAISLGSSALLPGLLTAFSQGRMTVSQILAQAPDECIVIPLQGVSSTNGYTIECRLKIDQFFNFTFGVNYQPLHVLALNSQGRPLLYSFALLQSAYSQARVWQQIEARFDMQQGIFNVSRSFSQDPRDRGAVSEINAPSYFPLPNDGFGRFTSINLVGIVLGSWVYPQCAYAELRIWNRTIREPGFYDRLYDSRMRRLDGREPNLVGYWPFDRGSGTELVDRARSGSVGKVVGGRWLQPSQADLKLDVSLEDMAQAERALWKKKDQYRATARVLAANRQETALLQAQTTAMQVEHERSKQKLTLETQSWVDALARIDAEYAAWKSDLNEGGRVALDVYSQGVAEEVDRASQALDEAKTPYALQGVDLEVKMLPVQTAATESSALQEVLDEDFRVVFPAMEDPNVQVDQLSTLSLSFRTQRPAAERATGQIPDVVSDTELAAARKLGQAGFRVEIVDEAVTHDEDVGRVLGQTPTANTERALDSIVTLMVGRASGAVSAATGKP